MNLDTLRLFRDIAQTRSLSRAAGLHGITPSAATQQVNELERTLGVLLLDRSTRPLRLTGEGSLYNDFCRDVLRRESEFQAALDDLRSATAGVVRVAAIYSVGLSEMTQLEEQFHRERPDVKLEIDYLRPERVYAAVSSDRADLGLVSYPEPSRDITALPWRQEEMAVATWPAHPLAQFVRLHPRDIDGLDFIAFDDDLPIAREITRYLKSAGAEVNVLMRFDNLQTIKEAVMLGSGISIVPHRVLRTEVSEGRIAAIPLAEPGLVRPLGIIHRKKKRFSPAAQAFLSMLVEAPEPEAAAASR